MRKVAYLLAFLFCTAFLFSSNVAAQRKVVGKVCGDPTATCSTRESFQAFELPFEYGKGMAISQSQLFYAVILKSVRLNADQSNCDKAIPESDRIDTQALFPHNMVFVMRCWESGQASYSNVADGVSFMGMYAGQTQAQANAFLVKVKATGKFNAATVRRMRVLINGT
jgi:hypothetical protein